MYAVIAYRWGLRDDHSYCVGIYQTLELAQENANNEIDDRAGKYGCEVVDKEGEQVLYIESPYFGNGSVERKKQGAGRVN